MIAEPSGGGAGLNLAGLGIGAVIGAIIAGAVAITLDQRRRNWEKKTRFQDDKSRLYKNFVAVSDVLVAQITPLARFGVTLKRFEREHVLNQAAADELTEILEEASKTDLDQLEEHYLSAVTELDLLAPQVRKQSWI